MWMSSAHRNVYLRFRILQLICQWKIYNDHNDYDHIYNNYEVYAEYVEDDDCDVDKYRKDNDYYR